MPGPTSLAALSLAITLSNPSALSGNPSLTATLPLVSDTQRITFLADPAGFYRDVRQGLQAVEKNPANCTAIRSLSVTDLGAAIGDTSGLGGETAALRRAVSEATGDCRTAEKGQKDADRAAREQDRKAERAFGAEVRTCMSQESLKAQWKVAVGEGYDPQQRLKELEMQNRLKSHCEGQVAELFQATGQPLPSRVASPGAAP